jgi:hypothetical protein
LEFKIGSSFVLLQENKIIAKQSKEIFFIYDFFSNIFIRV